MSQRNELIQINKAKEEKRISLNLSFCNMVMLPDEMSDLTWVKELDIQNNRELSDLRLLQNLGELTGLSISNTKVYDLKPIAGLSKLKELYIYNTKIIDLTPISHLENLIQLSISNTQVNDLYPLRALNNLKELSANNIQAIDLSPLSELSSLTRLTIEDNKLSDLSPLKKLIKLTTLSLSNTQIFDLKPLMNLENLNILHLANTQVSDLTPLANLSNLTTLSISNTQVSDLTPLANLSNLTTLSISNTQVSDLTPLSNLKNLTTLSLINTLVKDLSPLDNLKKINTLSVSNTKISDLKSLVNLKDLIELDVSNTQIVDLSPLSNLVNLAELDIYNTTVNDLDPIAKLNNLTEIYASNTQINTLNALSNLNYLLEIDVSNTKINDLTPLSNLSNLKELDVSNTQIWSLKPLKNIIIKNIKVKNESYRFKEGIYVRNCPLIDPPHEIINHGNEAIISYWEQIEKQEGTIELFEAKLIIVGEGQTGKTTLFEKLKNPDYKVGNTQETVGINIFEGLPFSHPKIGENIFHTNLWDFGGQDLQYMTHQFFLTPRALYVLMMDARSESPNLAYWLKIISLLGRENEDTKEKVKLLLVCNKRGITTGQPQYQDVLKFYLDTIESNFLEVDLAINDYRFENLKRSIEQNLVDLPIVKSRLPRLWKNVREDLRAENKNYISAGRFSEICSKYGIVKETDQWVLSNYLHQLGSLLHFQNDKGLRSWVILNPQWAVNGVYSFLSDKSLNDNYGYFTESFFIQQLTEKGYSRSEADLILQLMTKNNFDICYESNFGTYTAAQLLPDNKPDFAWYPKEVLKFRFQYAIMPKGLVSRLIVRLSEYLDRTDDGKQIVWKKGGVFRFELIEGVCRVCLLEDDAESKSGLRQILIEVMGVSTARKFALRKARDVIEDIHKTWFRGIKPDEIIPCCCTTCSVSDNPFLFKLENLLMRQIKRNDTSCDYSGEDIMIQTLLEGVYDPNEIITLNHHYSQNKSQSV